LALNASDTGVRRLIEQLDERVLPLITRYGSSHSEHSSEVQALDVSARHVVDEGLQVRFEAYVGEERLGELTLQTPGSYNAENAMGALAVLRALGLNFEHIKEALESYEGLENRFTIRRSKGLTIVKDYLSHPTGMRKVLESAQRFGGRKIWCVFKPYRFTLMRYHAHDYAEAFQGADDVLITTMYAANEPAIKGVDTPWFVKQLREAGNRTHFVPQQDELVPYLSERVGEGDLVFFFGGDDFFQMADAWADARDAEG
jgi:UDP-N-acetylmuramate--alanine ligase